MKQLPPGSLNPYDRNARTHSLKQIAQITASIKAFGFNNLAMVFANLAGHSADSAINFICMDWRHMSKVLLAATPALAYEGANSTRLASW